MCFFNACKPDFNLNAPYKDVPIVYGILNYQDSIHYVKIYKGFQPTQGSAYIDAQNPDSIYYYNDIYVVLQEFKDSLSTTPLRDIPLEITHDFPRDSGFFYYGKEKIIYVAKATLNKKMIYNIKITNKVNGKIIEGRTSLVGDFKIISSIPFELTKKNVSFTFTHALNAKDYELFFNFIYFEVDAKTQEVVKIGKIVKNLCPKIGNTGIKESYNGELYKEFPSTLYDDIAEQLKPNSNVIRYVGMPTSGGSCIEVQGWAAGESMIDFLRSNQPTSSFVQINNTYTNLTSSEGTVFGFISSRNQSIGSHLFEISPRSEDSLYFGSKTHHLGFRPWIEYKP